MLRCTNREANEEISSSIKTLSRYHCKYIFKQSVFKICKYICPTNKTPGNEVSLHQHHRK